MPPAALSRVNNSRWKVAPLYLNCFICLSTERHMIVIFSLK